MNILAIETSSPVLSVATATSGVVRAREMGARAGAGTEQFLALVIDALGEAGIAAKTIDVVAVGIGPGMFTSTRLGVSTAQGIALSAGVPVVPFSSLELLACQVATDGIVLTLVDARMGEVYAAWWRRHDGMLHRVGDMQCVAAEQIALPAELGACVNSESWTVLGSGVEAAWHRLPAQIRGCFKSSLLGRYPVALDAVSLLLTSRPREHLDPALLMPGYLRDKVALTTLERLGR